MSSRAPLRVGLVLLSLLSARASAQCPGWMPDFGLAGTTGVTRAIAAFNGEVYVGGDLTSAGGLPASQLTRWTGTRWDDLGAGMDGTVYALAVFDDGSGPALYVGGSFSTAGGSSARGIARWDGVGFTAVGGSTDGTVQALAVFDDGGGPALYAGGSFTQAGGGAAANLARWDGASWSPLGGGTNGTVLALASLVNASTRDLYVGGSFLAAGGLTVNRIARWSNGSWSALGTGVDDSVRALALFDDGAGRKLYAGGSFLNASGGGAPHVARWDGANWSPAACGTDGEVRALAVYDDGSGLQLYAGGNFNLACGSYAPRLARWNGVSWSALPSTVVSSVNALATWFDPGQGRNVLLAGGVFTYAGSPLLYTGGIASFDGASWGAIGGAGLNGQVRALAVFTPAGAGAPLLYVGGVWDSYHPGNILRAWDGTDWAGQWDAPHASPARACALLEHDDGSGRALYVAGRFDMPLPGPPLARGIVRFDGQNFSTVGPAGASGLAGFDNEVLALASFDSGSGPRLYAGGLMEQVHSTGQAIRRLASFDGANWSDVGGGVLGFYGNSDGFVASLQVFDDGSGPSLYVGGNFASAGAGLPIAGIARWDGSAWSELGGGLEGTGPSSSVVYAQAVYDDGSGPALYCGGNFNITGGPSYVSLAKWDGLTWTPIAGAPAGPIYALRVFDDNSGSGPQLEVGAYDAIARFDGTTWSYPSGGVDAPVRAFAAFDQGGDGSLDLVAGGEFRSVAGVQSSAIAMRLSCSAPGVPFCAGDGSLATGCPCANSGLPGRGCENSDGTGGARLDSSGVVSPDSVILSATHERAQALSIFLQGDLSLQAGASFGDGVRCVAGQLKRIAVANAFGGAASYPQPGQLPITQRSALLGDPIAPGSTRWYQVYYRDPDPSFCAPPAGASWNISNGLRIRW